jgi:hypothetical protein
MRDVRIGNCGEKSVFNTILTHCQILSDGMQVYFMAILPSLTALYPIFDNMCKDCLCAAREHSYQLSYKIGDWTGGRHIFCAKKEHTHIVKVNLIIDNLFKKSYIIVQMKGTHD